LGRRAIISVTSALSLSVTHLRLTWNVVTPSEIERRLADLERRIPQGMMVSTTYGSAEVRPFQVGFPVSLTSTFNSATGYSWVQNVLDTTVPEIDAPPLPRTGNMGVYTRQQHYATGRPVRLAGSGSASRRMAIHPDGQLWRQPDNHHYDLRPLQCRCLLLDLFNLDRRLDAAVFGLPHGKPNQFKLRLRLFRPELLPRDKRQHVHVLRHNDLQRIARQL
jgi:hypothetical protein